ncbi:cytochrome P450 6B7-like [Ostrinia nubilalis]|uniref:cytochrome P450 6B7-like n=1 Tax=Ostrinia furnacalis TaxID=93504 RepID=UPI00103FCC5E|nr:cytochrome P450 6B7-like [Ostrinia furnacalis]
MAVYIFAAFFVVILCSFYLYARKKYSYWSDKGVKGPTPFPIVGNFGSVILVKDSVQQYIKTVHLKYAGEKLVGVYRGFQPMLLVRDPDLIKQVMVKDFHKFQDRGISSSGSRLSQNLFSADGEMWRILRQKLTPVFTSRKLKEMVPLMQQCVDKFVKYVDYLVENNIDHEMRSLASKYTLDVIGSCAFGLDLDACSDEENQFSIMAKKIFKPTVYVRFLTILDMLIPGVRKLFTTSTEILDFFLGLVRNVIKEREGTPPVRKDFMDLMIELREQGKVSRRKEDGISEIEMDDYLIAAQALVFYSAGFETSAATMSFLFYELALNPDIQDRIYQEVCKVYEKYNGQLTYESLKEMPYLDMVLDETLRKHSVAGILFRKALEDYTIPGTNVTIPKGTLIMVSANGLHADPEYFPNPEKFNPDRFLPENIKTLKQCTYLPFGEGPRNCIGMRFAKVQSLMGIAAFLKNFKIERSPKTDTHLEYDPKGIVLLTKGGIWVKISKR